MGGVDFLDSLIARKVLENGNTDFCISSSMAQCWLRYKKYSPQMGVDHVPLQDFTMDLVLTLCTCI